jgi:hypothetical protein
MPTVGSGKSKMTFPYTKHGEEAAEKAAKKSGKKLTMAKKKKKM